MSILGDIIGRGATASKPAAGIPGRLYYNTSSEKWERDNGAAWEDCEPAAGSGGYTQGARVYHNAAQAITSGATTASAFNSERYDTDTIHDTSTNNGRLTCKTAGKYLITANVEWAANSTGTRQCWIYLNNTTIIAIDRRTAMTPPGTTTNNISTIYDLALNDYVELIVFQTSGGNLNLDVAANYSPEFMMQRIG